MEVYLNEQCADCAEGVMTSYWAYLEAFLCPECRRRRVDALMRETAHAYLVEKMQREELNG